MKELEGPLTNEKEQWLLKLRKHYDNLNQQSSLISQKEKKRSYFSLSCNHFTTRNIPTTNW